MKIEIKTNTPFLFFVRTSLRLAVLFCLAVLGVYGIEWLKTKGVIIDVIDRNGEIIWSTKHYWINAGSVLIWITSLASVVFHTVMDVRKTFGFDKLKWEGDDEDHVKSSSYQRYRG